MSERDAPDPEEIAVRLRLQALRDAIRISIHAHQEMVADDITYDQLREVLSRARVVENYPDHKRGPCCLLCGKTRKGRYVHVVSTTSLDVAIVITVYEPTAPKWVSPFERGKQQ